MSALFAIIASQPLVPTPAPATYAWASGVGGAKSVTWTNPNASPISVALGAWDDAAVSWVTSSPVVIAGGGNAVIQATKSSSSGVTLVNGEAVLTCTGDGSAVTTNAAATWYET